MVPTTHSIFDSAILAQMDEGNVDGKDQSANRFIERTLYDIIESIVRCRSIVSEDDDKQHENSEVPNGAGAAGRAQALPAPVGPRKSGTCDALRQPKGTIAPSSYNSAVTMLLGGEMYAWEAGDAIFLVDGPTAPSPEAFRSIASSPAVICRERRAKDSVSHTPALPPAHGSWAAIAGLKPRRGSGAGVQIEPGATAFGSGFRFDVGAVTAPLHAMGK